MGLSCGAATFSCFTFSSGEQSRAAREVWDDIPNASGFEKEKELLLKDGAESVIIGWCSRPKRVPYGRIWCILQMNGHN